MVLKAENIYKTFVKKEFLKTERIEVLKGVSFTVEREVFGFIGPNGAGKTTTIKIIMNLIKPTSGKVEVFGRSMDSVKHRIGFLPEKPALYPSITAVEYLNFCCDMYGIPHSERKRKMRDLLDMVSLLGFEKKRVSTYSKGMLQRLLFAASLINDPDLLILDEPMSGLDPIGRGIIADVIKELKNKGKAVFYSSHIIQDVERLSDRVAIIVGGEIVLCDAVSAIVSRYLRGYSVVYKADGGIKIREVDKDGLWKALEELRSKGCEIISIEPLRLSLEDIFVRLVRGEKIENIAFN